KHKLNSAYSRAKSTALQQLRQDSSSDTDRAELERRSDQRGAKKLIGSVESLTGVTIDHYAAVNLLGFYSITKAVGGVQVCLRNPVHDEHSGADFPAGKQEIAGADALAFVRQRHGLPRGDLDRIKRQQAFLAGVARKILSSGTLTDPDKLGDLTDAIQRSVVLDQGWDILDFAKRMRGLTGGQLEFPTIPVGDTSYPTPNDGMAVQVDPQRVHEWISGLGANPDDASSQQTPEDRQPAEKAAGNIDPAGFAVAVRNGNGTRNLASRVSATLTDDGFGAGTVANTTRQSSSVIRVADGEQAAGRRVAAALPENDIRVRESSRVDAGHVTVVLGTDYSPSGTGTAEEQSAGGSGGNSGNAGNTGNADESIDAGGIPCVN